jgi:hypothetical protein
MTAPDSIQNALAAVGETLRLRDTIYVLTPPRLSLTSFIYSAAGPLAGAFAGATLAYIFNVMLNKSSELAREKREAASEKLRWRSSLNHLRLQREMDSAHAVVNSLVRFSADLGDVHDRIGVVQSKAGSSDSAQGGTPVITAARELVPIVRESILPTWTQVFITTSVFPGDWLSLRSVQASLKRGWIDVRESYTRFSKTVPASDSTPVELRLLREALVDLDRKIISLSNTCEEVTSKVLEEIRTRDNPSREVT